MVTVIDSALSSAAIENGSINLELYIHVVEQMSWETFVDLLEAICKLKGWDVEYDDYSDMSIAIFAE
jgi:hypothetical protein